MSQSEAERGGGERGGRRGRQKDLLTFSELRFSSEEKKKREKKRAPIAYGASVKLQHQGRTTAVRAGACGRQLMVCQKRKRAGARTGSTL